MSRPQILIVEDSPADAITISDLAKEYGLPIVANSFEMAMSLLQSRHFDVVILDLTLGVTAPQDTIIGFALVVTRTPVVVVTGSEDPALKGECESRGWAWVYKESQYYTRTLNRAIDNALAREDSGTGHIPQSGDSRIDAILAAVNKMANRQAEMQDRLDKIGGAIEAVLDTMFGSVVDARTGTRAGGCVSRHQQAQKVLSIGGAWLWAVAISVAGACGGVVSWAIGKLTQ